MIRIGVDIGGTKMEIAALDEAGAELLRRRAPAPGGRYDEAVAAIAELVREAESEVGAPCSVGICTPGSVSSRTGVLKNAYASVLNRMPVRPDLERLLGREVRFANDANCFALSEATDGAAAGARVVFGAILGTGVGGGIVVDRQPLAGANAIAGEWGHNALPWPAPGEWPGPRCSCGRDDCIESFLSGPGLAADHLRATGEPASPSQIVSRAEAGGPGCNPTLERHEERLPRAPGGGVQT